MSTTLTRAAVAVVVVVMLVGGVSLLLAFSVFRNIDATASEYGHILALDELHEAFDDLIFEVRQMHDSGRREHATDALLMQGQIARQIGGLEGAHPQPAGENERAQVRSVVGRLRIQSDRIRSIAAHVASGDGPLGPAELEALIQATREVPLLTLELRELHQSRIANLLRDSRKRTQAIVALYIAFVLVGGALLVMGGIAASRAITLPLRRLADAALEIGKGHLDTRVSIRSANEIGLLSWKFNDMACELQEREHALRDAQRALEAKVRQTRALYHIGTEISRLQQLDRVLQSVVDRARELMRADAASLRLFDSEQEGVAKVATSGLPMTFPSDAIIPNEETASAASGDGAATSRVDFHSRCARGHIAVFLDAGSGSVGSLRVGTHDDRIFTEEEAELLAALGTQAAIAIERARLSDRVQGLAAVEERGRIAREMHDGLAQVLALLHLKLQSAARNAGDRPELAESLREMIHITDLACDDVRQSILGLRTHVLRGAGLAEVVAQYVREFSAQSGIAVNLTIAENTRVVLRPASEVQAIRIVQEALVNVRKHAAVRQARVNLEMDGGTLRVIVADDGIGFNETTIDGALKFGLQTMRERAESAGGHIEIESAPGRGTRIVATLPGALA